MLEKLFASKSRVEILKLFLFNSADRFYQRQIETLTHQPIRAVQRETAMFVDLGLLEQLAEGNRIYYRINKNNPIFTELKSIFLKNAGIAAVLHGSLKTNHEIAIAFIYGSYAKGNETSASDIDLFVLGTITSRELSTLLAKVKQQLGREINYSVMPESEFKSKVMNKDHFITSLLPEKKIYIVGTPDELKAITRTK